MPLSVNRLSQQLVRRLRRLLEGEAPGTALDLDDAVVVNELLAARELPPLDGPPRAVANRDGRLAVGESVYEVRDDVRRALPLALTPAGRRLYFEWFLDGGRHETAATLADLLLALFDQDARPDRGLVASYLVQPAWQAKFPDALTPRGWTAFKAWIADEYSVPGRWLRYAKLPPRYAATPQASLGVNVLGLFRHTSGLQQNVVAVVEALATAGVHLSLRDLPMPYHRDDRPRTGFDGLERFPVTLLDIGLDMPTADAYRIAGLHPQPGVRRIAVWSWELEQLPHEWLDRGRDIDEVWAPTTFIAEAVRPLGKPVYTMLTPVPLPAFEPLPKPHFGLDPDRFTFLFAFDMNSRLPRKNPLNLIRAFRRAFGPSDPVELALKVSPYESYYADWWRQLREAAAEANVKLIDRTLGRGELLALMNAADAYVSLHRSEGVGLTMAEAMLLGKPTIATGYSGNLDFMTPENSYLVRYERTLIAEDTPPYPKGFVWAEPSVEHAAELMRRVVGNLDEARAVGERGRADARRLLSPEVAGRRMAARLAEIARGENT